MIPQVQTTIFGLEQTMQFQIVKKTVVDGELAEAAKVRPVLWFEGSLQPLHPRELLVKPEGERKWKWWTLFTDLALEVDTVIKDSDGAEFRVMASSNWGRSGYFNYQIIEGPAVGR